MSKRQFCADSSLKKKAGTTAVKLLALAGLCIALLCGAASAAAKTDDEVVAGLSSKLDGLASQDKFSGTVLLAKRDEVLFEHAYGYADHAFGVRNRVDTKFNVASMGKMFTAVAVLQLVEQGKMSLDDTLAKDLPEYPNKIVADKVTIRQLLTHTSGLPDFFGQPFAESNMTRFDTLESLLPFFVEKPLEFKPGTKWSYSNAGYIVLGLVVQHIAGESYYDYVREHVFTPSGMRDTDNWPADADVPNRALGYTYMGQPEGAPRKSNVQMLQRGGSAGGGYSTVEDLFRFAEALENHKLLSKRYTDMAITGQFATRHPGAKYGFGFEETRVNGVRIVGHSGGGPGIQNILDIYPDQGYVVAIMTNYDDAMSPVDNYLRTALSGARQPETIKLNEQVLKSFAGTYAPAIPNGMKIMGSPPLIVVTTVHDGLDVNPGMGQVLHFTPISACEFVAVDNPGQRIMFVKNPEGQVTSLNTTTGIGPVPPITATKLP